jgi:hypothetical protein
MMGRGEGEYLPSPRYLGVLGHPGGPYFLVSLFRVMWPCEGLLGLLVMGPKDRVCGVNGGEMGWSMRESRVHGSAEWYGGAAMHRGVLPPRPRLGSNCVPLEVVSEYTCCGGVKG